MSGASIRLSDHLKALGYGVVLHSDRLVVKLELESGRFVELVCPFDTISPKTIESVNFVVAEMNRFIKANC